MRFLIDLFLLWKCVPVLLRHFKLIPQKTHLTDSQGNSWESSVEKFDGYEPTYVADRVTQEQTIAAGAGAAYAVYNLLNGGR